MTVRGAVPRPSVLQAPVDDEHGGSQYGSHPPPTEAGHEAVSIGLRPGIACRRSPSIPVVMKHVRWYNLRTSARLSGGPYLLLAILAAPVTSRKSSQYLDDETSRSLCDRQEGGFVPRESARDSG